MRRQQILTALILGGICSSAVAVAMLAVLVHGDLGAALVAAVALLALAQLVAYLSRASAKRDATEEVADLMTASDQFARDVSVLRSRMDILERRIAADATSAQVDGHVAALRGTMAGMEQDAGHNSDVALADASWRKDRNRSEPTLLGDPVAGTAQLFLEPIVRLSSNKTMYYRATIANDADMPGSEPHLLGGKKSLALFESVAPVVRRFQSRARAIGMFCPLSAGALSDEQFITRLIGFVEASQDIAGSLVIDISQPELAQLGDKGQRGLAYLAQLGTTFALSQCRLNVPDLAALGELGFGFIDANVQLLIDAKRGAPCPASDVLDEARQLGISLIAADVAQENEIAWIRDSFELARGPRFSPPRPVRYDLSALDSYNAAA